MEKAHIDEELLINFLKEVKEIETKNNVFVLHIKKISRIYIQIENDKMLINSISYNPTATMF